MVLRLIALLMLAVALLGQPHGALAHKIFPATATVTFDGDNRYRIDIKTNVEALIAGIGSAHEDTDQSPQAERYKALRALSAEGLRAEFDGFSERWLDGVAVRFDGNRVSPRIVELIVSETGDVGRARISTIRIGGQVPDGAESFGWAYDKSYGSSVLRLVHAAKDEMTTAWLKDGAASDPIPLAGMVPRTVFETAVDYTVLGFTHILPFGLDHILFVLGLYLLSTRVKPLLVQVTAFTVAHTVTLALGLYGVVTISPDIVEPLIALSIVYVAVENILTPRLTVWRPFIVFAFGLLHGLGFAGVLQEIGLPRDDFVTGLIAFNVGVEFGQLATIAIAWFLTGLWFRERSWYRTGIVYPGSAGIALIGAYWTVERVFFA